MSFENDGVHAGFNERASLFFEGALGIGLGKVAIGLQHRTERADVTEDEAIAVVERLAGEPGAGLVKGLQVLVDAMARQHDAVGTEGIGDKAVGAGFDVAFLNGQHTLRVGEIPQFAAGAAFQAGEHELCAHGSVADEGPGAQGFENR